MRSRCVRIPIKATAHVPIDRPDTYQRLPTARPHLRTAAGPYISATSDSTPSLANDTRSIHISDFRQHALTCERQLAQLPSPLGRRSVDDLINSISRLGHRDGEVV